MGACGSMEAHQSHIEFLYIDSARAESKTNTVHLGRKKTSKHKRKRIGIRCILAFSSSSLSSSHSCFSSFLNYHPGLFRCFSRKHSMLRIDCSLWYGRLSKHSLSTLPRIYLWQPAGSLGNRSQSDELIWKQVPLWNSWIHLWAPVAL